MITITINKEKKQIPTINEMTVRQFIKLSEKEDMNIINYLSVVLDISYKEAFDLKYKGVERLLSRMGTIEDYSKIQPGATLVIGDDVYKTDELSISTVGQRFMIEESGKNLKNEELLCFVLAVAILKGSMDGSKILELKEKILDMPYIKVLPHAFFLAVRFSIGRNSAINYMKMYGQLIRMRVLDKLQEFRNWLDFSIFMKFRRFARY